MAEGAKAAPKLQKLIQGLFGNVSIQNRPKTLPVSCELYGTTLFVRHERAAGYIGILDRATTTGLAKLLSRYKGVRLQFYILTEQAFHDPDIEAPSEGVPIQLNVYGPRSLFDVVGWLLLDCDLFLQRPDHIDAGVTYENPQSWSSSLTDAGSARSWVNIEDEVSALFESVTVDILSPTFLSSPEVARTSSETQAGFGIRTKLKKSIS